MKDEDILHLVICSEAFKNTNIYSTSHCPLLSTWKNKAAVPAKCDNPSLISVCFPLLDRFHPLCSENCYTTLAVTGCYPATGIPGPVHWQAEPQVSRLTGSLKSEFTHQLQGGLRILHPRATPPSPVAAYNTLITIIVEGNCSDILGSSYKDVN